MLDLAIRGGDVVAPHGTARWNVGVKDMYISRGKRNLSDKGFRESSAKLVPPGAVMMSSRAPIGYVAIGKYAVSTNLRFKSFVCGDGVRAEFVAFWLRFLRPFLEEDQERRKFHCI